MKVTGESQITEKLLEVEKHLPVILDGHRSKFIIIISFAASLLKGKM